MSTALDPPFPCEAPDGHELFGALCWGGFLAKNSGCVFVCLLFSQNETFYRFIYVLGIQIATVRVHLMLIALIANPLFIDSASNNLCLVLR